MAPDPVDRIILAEAGAGNGPVVVIDDVTGGLAIGASALGDGEVRAHTDLLTDQAHVTAEAIGAGVDVVWHQELTEALLVDAGLVLLRLPKSLAALDEVAEAVSRSASPGVRLVAGGRVKHMSHGMNRVLRRHFSTVTASLGQQKSRALLATDPIPGGQPSYPRVERHDDLDLVVCAHGAAFAGTAVDAGTRMLAALIPETAPHARNVVDLGCGTGILAVVAARQHPDATVRAIDVSAAACRSATATAAANAMSQRVIVQRADGLSAIAVASCDLVLCNPPFHRGTARDSDSAFAMFAGAGRALRPAGELWTVYNSHLPYLPALRRMVGSTTVVAQNPSYTVTRSRAPGRGQPGHG